MIYRVVWLLPVLTILFAVVLSALAESNGWGYFGIITASSGIGFLFGAVVGSGLPRH